jgi:hypothetical protein
MSAGSVWVNRRRAFELVIGHLQAVHGEHLQGCDATTLDAAVDRLPGAVRTVRTVRITML